MSARALLDFYCLKRDLTLPPSAIERIRTAKLREILHYAYRNVPFYHAKFKKSGTKPSDIRTIEDLSRIPMTTKKEVQTTPVNEMLARNIDPKRCVKNSTSGSTGIPLTTFVDRKTAKFEGAWWLRAFLENGFRLVDKRVIIHDPRNFPKKKKWFERFGIMRRKYVSIFDHVERQAALILKERPDVIEGFPSSLTVLASFVRQNGYYLRPRLIFSLGEVLDAQSRDVISAILEADLFDYYGSSEFSLMAWECREHAGYHINAHSLIMEFLKNGEVVSGEHGEIVCTSLVNHAMPLIRYRIGDVGVPVEDQCSCGNTLPLMKLIEGRCDDYLVATDGRIIPPTVFFPYPFKDFEGIEQFKVIQEKGDRLKILLVISEGFLKHPQVLEEAELRIQELFGEDMQVEFQIVDKIDRNQRGKLQKIVSHVSANISI